MLRIARQAVGCRIREKTLHGQVNMAFDEVGWPISKSYRSDNRSLCTVPAQSALLQLSSESFQSKNRRFSIGPKRIQLSKERQSNDHTEAPGDVQFSPSKRSPGPETSHLERVLFQLAKSEGSTIPASFLLRALKNVGLWKSDPRLAETIRKLNKCMVDAKAEGRSEVKLDEEQFLDCIRGSSKLVKQALTDDFVIPEFSRFTKTIDEIYSECRSNYDGLPASYIPQLARFSPDLWGVSLCTVDGQRHAVGDVGVPFTVQSSSKPINYAFALNELGPEFVHKYVGHEPSGESFNCIKLDSENKPHNPMINPGAIIASSLIRRDLRPAERFDFIMSQYKRVVGHEYLAFNNAVYLSERETADRNFAIGYCLQENNCFPDNCDFSATMNLYFQLCSIEINANSGAIIAATLANGGKCPTTDDEILSSDSVRNTLALMQSCGMYDYSGGFAFKVGLPAKSAVSGAILVVIPNVAGLCLWSPPLDKAGNSVRGVQFCEELVKRFQFHPYDSFNSNRVFNRGKSDPRVRKSDMEANQVTDLLSGASIGDLTALRRMALANQDMTAVDYDRRSALHMASAEGHMECVRFLVEECKVPVDQTDRWGCTPLDDASKFGRNSVQDFLQLSHDEAKMSQQGF